MALRTKWRQGDDFLVRHVDPSIIVVEKAAGLLTHTTPGKQQPNLHDKVRRFVKGRGPSGVLPVHRLDRVVSGLIVYARTKQAQEFLIERFAEHDVERKYVAAISGKIEGDKGTFDNLLVTNHKSTRVFSTTERNEGTRRAITHWRVLERFDSATLVEVELETGIRNQIRVHFAEAGHALLGEQKYKKGGRRQKTARIFLHAKQLCFEHPYTKKQMRFEAPLPPDLSRWRRRLMGADVRSNT